MSRIGNKIIPITEGVTVTVKPGTQIQCNAAGTDIVIDGKLICLGTENQPIDFINGGSSNYISFSSNKYKIKYELEQARKNMTGAYGT